MSKRICAWCEKVMGISNTQDETHGICDDCLDKMRNKLKEEKAKKTVYKWEKEKKMDNNVWFILVLGSLLMGYFIIKALIEKGV